MSWLNDQLANANCNLHVVTTGGGAGLQQTLWEVPGSSSYLSGCSFPYSTKEQQDLLGFMPSKSCCEETAIDLASAAYMKALEFSGKRTLGLGLTASVASNKEHRGDHRVFACLISDDKVYLTHTILKKSVGLLARKEDGKICDTIGEVLLSSYLLNENNFVDTTGKADARFFTNPFFSATGERSANISVKNPAIMPGAFNPPHEGHYGMVDEYEDAQRRKVIFAITANAPHKPPLTFQECLKRAKMLQGRNRLFSKDDPLYLDKARLHTNTPMVIGADALLRMFDPKWGLDLEASLQEFWSLGTKFGVFGRVVNGKFMDAGDAIRTLPKPLYDKYRLLFSEVYGKWDISSTELRNKKK